MNEKIRTDCRHYVGEKPCAPLKVCWQCDAFAPIGRRALVLKFGAPGDALRTTPLLARLRREGFTDITWICDEASREVLAGAKNIDRLLVAGSAALALVQVEEFDAVFSCDKAPEALALAMLARSADKRGFALTPAGRLTVFNPAAEYALRLGMDDELKFRENKLTVPALVFQMCGFEYAGEEYEYEMPTPLPPRRPDSVALNLGVGPRWPTKAWPRENWVALARALQARGGKPFFVGGPAERDLVTCCAALAGCAFHEPAPLAEFAAHLAAAAVVVTADSLALHLALAVKTPVVGLFCSTQASEIEWFGRGKALVSSHGPCYNPHCANWPGCMAEIPVDAVAAAVAPHLKLA